MSHISNLKDYLSGGRFNSIFILSCLLVLILKNSLNAQEAIPHTEINAELNEDHTLRVYQTIDLVNTSDSTWEYIYLHGWINGYSSKKTALSKTLLEGRKKDLYFAKPHERGFFKLIELKSKYHPIDYAQTLKDSVEILKIHMKKKIAPNETVSLKLHYKVKIPNNRFTAYGFDSNIVLLKYWYFLPAVFENNKWILQTNRGIDDLYARPTTYKVNFSIPYGYFLKSNLEQYPISKNEYVLYGEKTKPFTIELSKTMVYDEIRENKIQFIFNSPQKYHIPIKTTKLYFNKISKFLNSSLGEMPISKIFLSNLLNKTQNFYGIQNINIPILKKEIVLFPDEFKWELSLLKQITHEVLYQSLFLNRRKDNWIYEGIKTYLIMKYLNEFHPEKQLIGNAKEFKILGFRPAKNLYLANLNLVDRYRLAYIYLARNNFDQPIKTTLDSMANINFIAISGFKTALGIRYLNDYLGKKSIDRAIKSFFQKNKSMLCHSYNFENEIKASTKKDLSWFFDDFLNSKKKIDYKIKKYRKEGNHLLVSVKNKTGFAAPIQLTAFRGDSIITQKWFEGFKGEKDLEFPIHYYDYDRLAINDNFIVPEIQERNNYLITKGIFKNSKRLQFKIIPDIENPKYNQIFLVPEFEYNNYDKLQIGLGISNYSIFNRPFKFKIKPKFSTGPRKLTGNISLNYHFNPNDGIFQKVSFNLGGQYKHYEQNLSFVTLSPSVDFNLKKKYPRSDRNDILKFKYIFIDKELDPELPPDDEYFSRYSVFDAKYEYDNPKLLNKLQFNVDFQLADAFGKVITDWRYQIYTSSHRQIGIRFFAGVQYFNNTETDYFDFGIDRINDYLFESDLIGRSEERGFLFQQLVLRDGGFKSNFNQRANQWLLSTNLDIQVWKVFWLYADAGFYKNRNFKEQFIYDSGIKLELIKDFLEFYFPIQSSLGFEPSLHNYKNRIRFVLSLNLQKAIRYIRRGLY